MTDPCIMPLFAHTAFLHSRRASRASRHCTAMSRLLFTPGEVDWMKDARVARKGARMWGGRDAGSALHRFVSGNATQTKTGRQKVPEEDSEDLRSFELYKFILRF